MERLTSVLSVLVLLNTPQPLSYFWNHLAVPCSAPTCGMATTVSAHTLQEEP